MIYITTYPLLKRINHNAQTLTDYGGGRGGALFGGVLEEIGAGIRI
jgi:hypothetical protein